MKNKKSIIALIVIVCIIIAILVIFIIKNNASNKIKIDKGYKIFGNDYCEGHEILKVGATVVTPWSCKICGYSETSGTNIVPAICSKCAKITGRCSECGKLK